MNDNACGSRGWLCFHGKLRSTMQVTFSFYYSPIIYVHTSSHTISEVLLYCPKKLCIISFLYPPHPLIFEKHISRVVQEATNLCSEYSEQFFFWFWFQIRKLLLCKFQGGRWESKNLICNQSKWSHKIPNFDYIKIKLYERFHRYVWRTSKNQSTSKYFAPTSNML